MESGLDFDKLPMLNDIERPDLDSDSKNSINKRSESAKEKHARNELLILSAAIKFKETSSDIFNEKCLKRWELQFLSMGQRTFRQSALIS